MRYLGLDLGSRTLGIAISETGFIVFSQSLIINCCQLCDAKRGADIYI